MVASDLRLKALRSGYSLVDTKICDKTQRGDAYLGRALLWSEKAIETVDET